ncbi:hypothetical protein [Alicyclobacillus macrosporangiidus]|uniref:Uncharacterized protein n=1 Tax=Alicyclobacillus macrosporangiidus TaxID=392015 RepID=A0A1I7IDR1_9BACL|nr:hypothetical protein [Alicyclobacillus macrosporangiidus]SFU71067.1 hypothetical protein SAMN05421543_106158 [Alicyclobacillus macrosporangiidus]
MLKAMVKVSLRLDKTSSLAKALHTLAKTDVLVGIPQGSDREDGPITNAQLLYIHEHGVRSQTMREAMQPDLDRGVPYSKAYDLFIHEHGSPLWKIPPRPVLEPSIATVKPKIAEWFKKATDAALNGDDPGPYLDAAGKTARDAAFNWFTDPRNGWPPNAPSTIKAKGSDRPLIDTGEMRKAITWVVRER